MVIGGIPAGSISISDFLLEKIYAEPFPKTLNCKVMVYFPGK